MRLLFYILFLVFISSSLAQKQLAEASKAFGMHEFVQAISLYKEALRKINNQEAKQTVLFNIGKSYQALHDYQNALSYYERSYKAGNGGADFLFEMGSMLQSNERYEEAVEIFNKYLEIKPEDKFAKARIASCNYAIQHNRQDFEIKTINLSNINTLYSDYSPVLFYNHLMFTSSRPDYKNAGIYSITGQAFSDFYISQFNNFDRSWDEAENVPGEINTKYNDGTCWYDKTSNTLYFMQCNGPDGKISTCHIYTSVFNTHEKTWSGPHIVRLGNTDFNQGHPSLNKTGNKIYFTSDMPGGIGGKDIWYAARQNDGLWSGPVNAGDNINTIGDEQFPFVFRDSLLYFSSDGHPGFGGLDIFYSVILKDGFSVPVNLNKPLNSGSDDFGIYLFSADSGLLSSNRPGGKGDDDIYLFYTHREKINIGGRIKNSADNKKISGAVVILTDGGDFFVISNTDENGFYNFKNIEAFKEYAVVAFKDGYLGDVRFIKSELSAFEKLEISSQFDFDLFEVSGDEIKIKNIYYDFGKWNLTPESQQELERLVNIMNMNPDINIRINSHTDVAGDGLFNQELSDYRAKAVVDFLIKKSVGEHRLSWKGWGESKPIVNDAQNEAEHQLNRRTTFQIVNPEKAIVNYSPDKYKELVSSIMTSRVNTGFAEDTFDETRKIVVFRVQIYAGNKKMTKSEQAEIEKLIGVYSLMETCDKQGVYRYAVGEFNKYEQAKEMNDLLKANNYEPFITAFMNEIRITILEARQLTEW